MTGTAPSVVTEIAEPGGGLMLRMTMERGTSTARRKNGAPEGIRTPDLCLRRAALYPAELRARGGLHSRTGAAPQLRGLGENATAGRRRIPNEAMRTRIATHAARDNPHGLRKARRK